MSTLSFGSAQDVPLLRTKLYIPPVRPGLVSRPRLIERLNAGLGQNGGFGQNCRFARKLTLISAPAGSGKTTLVSAWLQHLKITGGAAGSPAKVRAASKTLASTWLSLDEGDNDAVCFFTYLVAALQKIDDEFGQTVQNLLKAPQLPAVESLVTALINDIAVNRTSFVLVMDDYHAITELDIHKAVEFLLERQPPQMHLVIATRQDPPLPLSRLRVRGQVSEIRQSDLRFTPEEAAIFLNQSMGLEVTASGIAALEGRTEGWIAGLQLAALSMQGRDAEGIDQFIAGFSGRYHFILDYLTDEVLKRQPEPVQAFLLQTSILERMCGSLCDAVMGIGESADQRTGELPTRSLADSQAVLEYLEHANLFLVPLDDERRWYRYHHLFAELLRARLQETQPGQVLELHRRAAAWYERNGLVPEAVHHALATQDFALAAEAIERAIMKVATWSSTDVAILLRWLKALPDDAVRTRPWLGLFTSRALYVSGQPEVADHTLRELEKWLRDNPSAPDAERLLGLIGADRASYAAVLGNVQQAIEFARQALAHAPEDDAVARFRAPAILGMACFRAGDVSEARRAFSQAADIALAAGLSFAAVPFFCNLAEVQIVQGQLDQAIHTCERAMQLGTVDGERISAAGFVELELGKILYERNELQAAERCLLDGLELLSGGGIAESFGNVHAVLAQVRQGLGDDQGAQVAIQQAVESAQSSNVPRLSIRASAYQARIWLAQRKLDLAVRWAREYRQIGETEYLREFEDLTLARVLLARNEPAEALALLETLLPPAETAGRMGRVIEILALRALALQALNDISEALDALGRALRLAEPEGYVRVFVDEGEPMVELLRHAASQGIMPQCVSQLLAAFGASEFGRGGEPLPHPQPLIEPLTDREIEVLYLLAEGLSNPEIVQRLFISLPTVKSHTRNIYGKLGVHSRGQAVAQARTLGILPPL